MTSRTLLPQGWKITTVGELFDVLGGGTPATSKPSNWSGSIPWVTSADLYGDLTITPRRHISDEAVRDSATNVVPPGSVIVATRVGLGKVGLTTVPTAFSQDCHALIVDISRVLPSFAAYQMRALARTFTTISRGTTIAGITRKDLLASPFRLPPLRDQHRVVGELEKHLSRLTEAAVGLDRSVTGLEVYRRALLESSVTGRLMIRTGDATSITGGDRETAQQLLDRARELVDARRESLPGRYVRREDASIAAREVASEIQLPEGWMWARWGDIAVSQNGRAFPSAQYSNAGVRLLRPGNLHASGRVDWSAQNTRRLPLSWADSARDYLLGPNELVMNLTAQSLRDEFLGRVCRTSEGEPALLNQRIARLTPLGADQAYIFWVLKSPLFRRFVRRLNTGSLIQHMFTSQLDGFLLPLPPLTVQRTIAQEVERQMSIIDELGMQIRSDLHRVQTLSRAVLDAALDGQLLRNLARAEPA